MFCIKTMLSREFSVPEFHFEKELQNKYYIYTYSRCANGQVHTYLLGHLKLCTYLCRYAHMQQIHLHTQAYLVFFQELAQLYSLYFFMLQQQQKYTYYSTIFCSQPFCQISDPRQEKNTRWMNVVLQSIFWGTKNLKVFVP